MYEYFMKRATFSEICRIMQHRDDNIRQCISGIFELGLLFLPGLICKETYTLMQLSNSLTLLDTKGAIKKSIAAIQTTFGKHNDFSTRYNDARIAHVLIVFAAYFDTIKEYLPDAERAIHLSDNEKLIITVDSLEKYRQHILECTKEQRDTRLDFVFDYDLELPNQIDGFLYSLNHLKQFYNILNNQFTSFISGLYYIEKENKSSALADRFMPILRSLPDIAINNYQKQYYELAASFNDFFVFSNMKEHASLKYAIDIGFENIPKLIREYSEEKVIETLNRYPKRYNRYIKKPIFNFEENGIYGFGDVLYPQKCDIFLPQSFKAIRYSQNMKLESIETWKDLDERQNIGKFIGDTLRHPQLGAVPMLILGVPGAGKTLLCHMLAAKILCKQFHIIIIRLRDTIADASIQQQIDDQIKRDFSNECTWDKIAHSELKKPVLLIFDGYDELLQASGKTYADFINKIWAFQQEQLDELQIFVRCIITSRTTLIDKARVPNNSPVISLSDFDEQRIDTWIKIWNQKNALYFAENNLDPFSIDTTSKVYELAKQPLLLSMLALFDSSQNGLKNNQDMTGCELYNCLIRHFVEREQRKNETFRNISNEDLKAKIIDTEVRRISIAAIGMYNRKQLHIDSEDLKNDLNYFQTSSQPEEATSTIIPESEILFGRFFFINRMDAREHDKQTKSAYEFLHNTFGEFLTAYFIVEQLSLLTNDIPTDTWYTTLSYTPLFSRSKVIEMIHEWSNTYFKDNSHIKLLDILIETELHGLLNGKCIGTLNRITMNDQKHFPPSECINHLSIYIANLLILRTALCKDIYTIDFSKFGKVDIWDKLICIWKYSFTDTDFTNFSKQFRAEKHLQKCSVQYFPNNFKPKERERVTQLCFNSDSLDDKIMYCISSSLLGISDYRKTLNEIGSHNFQVEARYIWNYFLNVLTSNSDSSQSISELLSDFRKYSIENQDIEYMFAFYLALHYYLRHYTSHKLDFKESRRVAKIISSDFDILQKYSTSTNNSNIVTRLIEVSFSIFDYLDLSDEETGGIIQNLLSYFLEYTKKTDEKNLFQITKVYNMLIDYHVQAFQRRDVRFSSGLEMLTEQLSDYMWFTPGIKRVDQEFVSEILKFTYNTLILKDYGYHLAHRLYTSFDAALLKRVVDDHYKVTVEHACMTIKCLHLFQQIRSRRSDEIELTLRVLLRHVTIKELFVFSPEPIIQILILVKYLPNEIDQIVDDLTWIAKTHGESIPLSLYKVMHNFAKKMSCTHLSALLDGIIRL